MNNIDFSRAPVADHPDHDLRWLITLQNGLKQRPFFLRAFRGDEIVGHLPLMLVQGPIFGKFLVSLPYINSSGIFSQTSEAQTALIDEAVNLADQLNCRYLELRHEQKIAHDSLNAELTSKVHMRLMLPQDVETLRSNLKASVRNQVKKGEKQGFQVVWGREELFDEFYEVFAIRMRQLGTPVFGKELFTSIINNFSDRAEICSVRDEHKCISAALLIHGETITEVPSAAHRVEYNKANVNMLMYWNLLSRSVERGQQFFDFGRSTRDGPTFRFKKQWGSEPYPTCWQYYLRQGDVNDMRPDSGNKKFLIECWKRLPLSVTKLLGPSIVRGIP